MLKLLIRLLLIVLVAMGIFIAWKKSDSILASIGQKFGIKYKAVAGAHTGPKQENALTKTVQHTVSDIEKQIMNVKIGDIASAAGQLQAVGKQLNEQKDALLKQVQGKK